MYHYLYGHLFIVIEAYALSEEAPCGHKYIQTHNLKTEWINRGSFQTNEQRDRPIEKHCFLSPDPHAEGGRWYVGAVGRYVGEKALALTRLGTNLGSKALH